MKPSLAVLVPLAVLFGTLLGLYTGSIAARRCARAWDSGWNAGFAARDAQAQDANSRLIASGICRYADLACAGSRK